MNVFLREMRANWKSLFWWSIGMLFMIYASAAKYSAYTAPGADITQLISQIPATLRAALGFGDLDVSKASGFYGLAYLYLLLMATIHAALLGANIIAKEERDRTSEFLMVKPASRSRIVSGKLAAALANIVVLNLVTLGLSIAIINPYAKGEYINGDILLLMGAMFILQLVFLLLGSAIAATSRNPKSSASIATTVMLVTYILSIVVGVSRNLDFLKYLTPFKYFDASAILKNQGYDPLYVALSVCIIAALVFSTYFFYNRRDLKL